jgi:hypothetical protein
VAIWITLSAALFFLGQQSVLKRMGFRVRLRLELRFKLLIDALYIVAPAELRVQLHDASIEVFSVAIDRDRYDNSRPRPTLRTRSRRAQ